MLRQKVGPRESSMLEICALFLFYKTTRSLKSVANFSKHISQYYKRE